MVVANTLAFYDKSAITAVKSYGFRRKLVRLSEQMKMPNKKGTILTQNPSISRKLQNRKVL
jgi:hypothetical protein